MGGRGGFGGGFLVCYLLIGAFQSPSPLRRVFSSPKRNTDHGVAADADPSSGDEYSVAGKGAHHLAGPLGGASAGDAIRSPEAPLKGVIKGSVNEIVIFSRADRRTRHFLGPVVQEDS